MKGFKKVEDKSIGQVLDSIFEGEDYYYGNSLIVLDLNFKGSVISCEYTRMGVSFLKGALENGSIYQKVDWTEQLDGSYENGVWCKVWNDIFKVFVTAKIIEARNNPYTYPFRTLSGSCWEHAEPVSEELAELLEKEMK